MVQPLADRFPAVLDSAQRGDESAFTELFRAVQPALLRYLRAFAPAVAEDVASEAWLRVVADLGRFRGDEAGFRAWVFTIARHRWLDGRRAAARRPPEDLGADDRLLAMPGGDDVADAVEESVSTESALRLIAGLPPDQAEVVMLRVVAGLDVERTAAVVGKSPGAVRVLAHRGLKRLAALVEPKTQV